MMEFVAALRSQGVRVGTSELIDGVKCERIFRGGSGEDLPNLFLALRAVLVKRIEDYDTFLKLFEQFFSRRGDRGTRDAITKLVPNFASRARIDHKKQESEIPMLEKDQNNRNGPDKGEKGLSFFALYSKNRSPGIEKGLRDLEPFDPEQLRLLARRFRMISRVKPVLPGRRRARRNMENRFQREVDWRRFMRETGSNPDAISEIRFRGKKPNHSKLVLFADVSGSMLREAELVINSLFTASRRFHGTEVFAFSTNLSRHTNFFASASASRTTVEEFLSKEQEIEIGSGTRIGENLARLLNEYPSVINKDATLVIISDGWDLGDQDLLRSALVEIKKKGAAIVWFHPGSGYQDFVPSTLAMKTAFPFVDLLVGPGAGVIKDQITK